jgi:chromosomal replication initiation ATPase DnaA
MLEAYRRGRQSALEPKAPPLTGKDYLQQVIRDVAVLRGVSIVDIMGSSRVKHIARARQEVAWRMRQAKDEHGKSRFSFPQIAHWMGGYDHSTIVHAVKSHEARMQEADQ